jgi:3',5'-cyclic AMP phosphodiesterase CpdA
MAMAGLTWLHLSDWHQKGMEFDRKVVRDALLEDIKKRRHIHPDLEKLDFIVFSGDLAFSGKKEEYKAAKKYLLDPLLYASGLDISRIFIVPGNHDLDRDSFELLPDGIKKPLTEEKEIKEWLEDNKKRSRMLEPFEAFNEFVKDYAGGSFSGYADSYRLAAAGKEIALLGFNSALMCGRRRDENYEIDDKGKLMVGEHQVYDSLRKNQDADLRIVVMHHPFDWLTEQDCNRVEIRLKQEAHFILCGHQHRPKVTIETGTAGDCIIIPAGASYDRRKGADPQYNNAYNFVHLDFERNKGVVYLRCWSDRLNKWREDIDAYKDGCFVFSLPNGLSNGTYITPPTGIVLEDKQSNIVMTADINIIEQIEKQIGEKLKRLLLKNIRNMGKNGYFLNHVGQVQGLNLDGTKAKDISILGNLGGLTHLSLAYNQITDITPLRTLTNLRNLELRYNKIEDITPLAALTHLERLILINTRISDISPLSVLIEINTLSLSDNKIIGLSPLIPLTSLTSLQLNKNKINDLTPLKALTQLEKLGVRLNRITDLIPLKELTNLKGLNASRNNITKLPPDIYQWWSSMEWTWVDDDTTDKGFYLFCNPLTDPPVEIVKQGRSAVKNYFDSKGDRQGSIHSNAHRRFDECSG